MKNKNEKLDKKKLLQLIQFFAILISIIGLYYAIVMFLSEEIFEPYLKLNALLSGALIKIFDSTVIIDKNMIITNKINMILSFGCEGSEALVIFLAGVLAFPANWKYKMKGILIGFPLLYVLNLFRVLILYLVVLIDASVFDLFHSEILPVVFIVVSLLFWYYWLKNIQVKS